MWRLEGKKKRRTLIRDLSVAFDWFGRVSYGPNKIPIMFLLLVGEEGSIKLASFELEGPCGNGSRNRPFAFSFAFSKRTQR